MLFEVLTQQVLAVVVAVRRAHDRVDVLPSGDTRRQLTLHADGTLVVELDQDDGTSNPVENTAFASLPPIHAKYVSFRCNWT